MDITRIMEYYDKIFDIIEKKTYQNDFNIDHSKLFVIKDDKLYFTNILGEHKNIGQKICCIPVESINTIDEYVREYPTGILKIFERCFFGRCLPKYYFKFTNNDDYIEIVYNYYYGSHYCKQRFTYNKNMSSFVDFIENYENKKLIQKLKNTKIIHFLHKKIGYYLTLNVLDFIFNVKIKKYDLKN